MGRFRPTTLPLLPHSVVSVLTCRSLPDMLLFVSALSILCRHLQSRWLKEGWHTMHYDSPPLPCPVLFCSAPNLFPFQWQCLSFAPLSLLWSTNDTGTREWGRNVRFCFLLNGLCLSTHFSLCCFWDSTPWWKMAEHGLRLRGRNLWQMCVWHMALLQLLKLCYRWHGKVC